MMAKTPHEDEDLHTLARASRDVLGQDDQDQDYALEEVVEAPPRHDLIEISQPAKWCLACGCELTLVETGICPRCEKKFDPTKPSTFSHEPPREPGNWWLQAPRLAGYALIPLCTVGRIAINLATPGVGKALTGTTGGDRVSAAAGAVLSALAVLCLIPWLISCVLLALTGIREYFAPKAHITVALGAGFGLLFMMGYHPTFGMIGLGAGALAGFLYAWRAL